MQSKTLTLLPTLATSGALLGLALLAVSLGAGRSSADEVTTTTRLVEAEVDEASAAPTRHRRHARGLTMPYFSFAQSLRPRN